MHFVKRAGKSHIKLSSLVASKEEEGWGESVVKGAFYLHYLKSLIKRMSIGYIIEKGSMSQSTSTGHWKLIVLYELHLSKASDSSQLQTLRGQGKESTGKGQCTKAVLGLQSKDQAWPFICCGTSRLTQRLWACVSSTVKWGSPHTPFQPYSIGAGTNQAVKCMKDPLRAAGLCATQGPSVFLEKKEAMKKSSETFTLTHSIP